MIYIGICPYVKPLLEILYPTLLLYWIGNLDPITLTPVTGLYFRHPALALNFGNLFLASVPTTQMFWTGLECFATYFKMQYTNILRSVQIPSNKQFHP